LPLGTLAGASAVLMEPRKFFITDLDFADVC